MIRILILLSAGFLLSISNNAFSRDKVFDMHMHYKWSQKEVTTPEDAIALMDKSDISHAVVMGKPADLALKVQELAPERVVAIYSPYSSNQDWYLWQRRESVVTNSEAALKSGKYHGIGELHIIGGGFARRLSKGNILKKLMLVAEKYDVPIMLHTEFSRPDYMLDICKMNTKVKILWAHAGAILKPKYVDQVMTACPNVHGGMGASDPWRYNQHTDKNYQLKPAWKALFLKYPNRFMVGSDTVWPVDDIDSWHTPDTGWQELDKFWDFHRQWLSQLPKEIEQKIMRENAIAFFKLKKAKKE